MQAGHPPQIGPRRGLSHRPRLDMTIEQILQVYEAQPFHPFVIHLADGREIPVQHREFLASAPSGRTIIVYQPDDSFNIVDLLLVTDLHVQPNGVARPSKRRRKK